MKYRLFVVVVFGAVLSALACTKPVFRYALERWHSSGYELSTPDAGLTNLVPENTENFYVRGVSNAATSTLVGFEQFESKPVWTGNPDTLRRQLYSRPACEIIRGIVAGDATVWVVVHHGAAPGEVKKARTQLEAQLDAFADKIKLPHELSGTPYDQQLAPGIPLTKKFSIVELDLSTPETALFLRTIEKAVPGFDPQGGIRIMPVFGRARALDLLSVDELTDEVALEIAVFLTGACSCRVKALNPGFDLPVFFPWDQALWEPDFDADEVLDRYAKSEEK